MKKLFGGIDLTWKKLIIFSIIAAIYTAIMAIIPITADTSFRDISVQFEWWILFGIVIITNSKSPIDSALKCFVFFLISQPLIYLIQVPFSYMGWQLFNYYKYWFIWTILTLPMGFIGYFIKKNNILSCIILLPMLLVLAFLGLGYLNSAIDNFPHHILSFIACFIMIITIVLSLFDKLRHRLFNFIVIGLFIVTYFVINGGLANSNFEVIRTLNEYNLDLNDDAYVSSFTGTKKGNVELKQFNESFNVKLIGKKGGKYTFTLTDKTEKEYTFEYYYDPDDVTIVLKLRD